MNDINFPFYGQLELMGHIRHIGLIEEVEVFGSKMCRCRCIKWDPETQSVGYDRDIFVSASSIYRLAPCTEDEAHRLVTPYRPVELPTSFEDDEDEYDAIIRQGGC